MNSDDLALVDAAARDGLRLWEAPWEEDHHSEAFALTASHFLHRKFEKKKHTKKFRERLEAGDPLEEAFGKKKKRTCVPLADVRRVRYQPGDAKLRIAYRGHDGSGKVVVDCAEPGPQRAVFEDLLARIAPGVHPYPGKLSAWEAAKDPLVALAITLGIGGFFLVCHYAFEGDEEAGGSFKRKIVFWIVKTLGLWGIVGLFGSIALGLLIWLIRRVGDPPEVEEITLA